MARQRWLSALVVMWIPSSTAEGDCINQGSLMGMSCDGFFFSQNSWGMSCKDVETNIGGVNCEGCVCPSDDGTWKEYIASTECDVDDGSALSSQYPCMCGSGGGHRCANNELCTANSSERCSAAPNMTLSFPGAGNVNMVFQLIGSRAWTSKSVVSPMYSNGLFYLYWDISCDGNQATAPRWMIDTEMPPTNQIGINVYPAPGCDSLVHIEGYELFGPPSGTHTWQTICDDGEERDVPVTIHTTTSQATAESTGAEPDLCITTTYLAETMTATPTSTSATSTSITTTTTIEVTPSPTPAPTPEQFFAVVGSLYVQNFVDGGDQAKVEDAMRTYIADSIGMDRADPALRVDVSEQAPNEWHIDFEVLSNTTVSLEHLEIMERLFGDSAVFAEEVNATFHAAGLATGRQTAISLSQPTRIMASTPSPTPEQLFAVTGSLYFQHAAGGDERGVIEAATKAFLADSLGMDIEDTALRIEVSGAESNLWHVAYQAVSNATMSLEHLEVMEGLYQNPAPFADGMSAAFEAAGMETGSLSAFSLSKPVRVEFYATTTINPTVPSAASEKSTESSVLWVVGVVAGIVLALGLLMGGLCGCAAKLARNDKPPRIDEEDQPGCSIGGFGRHGCDGVGTMTDDLELDDDDDFVVIEAWEAPAPGGKKKLAQPVHQVVRV